jgi:hypothetical protein
MKIHPEARKHGIADADIEHTIAHATWIGHQDALLAVVPAYPLVP